MDRLPLTVAAVLLIGVAAWNTDRFQRWAYPESYYEQQIRRLQEHIAFGRAMIREHEAEIAEWKGYISSSPEDVEAFVEVRRYNTEEILAEEEMIEMYRQNIEEFRQRLAQFRGDL